MRAFEYGVNNRVSPATVELLICERSKGKSIRQLGRMFGRSHERARQLLAKYDRSQVTLLPESRVAAKLDTQRGGSPGFNGNPLDQSRMQIHRHIQMYFCDIKCTILMERLSAARIWDRIRPS